jgi:hypothetical protein
MMTSPSDKVFVSQIVRTAQQERCRCRSQSGGCYRAFVYSELVGDAHVGASQLRDFPKLTYELCAGTLCHSGTNYLRHRDTSACAQ